MGQFPTRPASKSDNGSGRNTRLSELNPPFAPSYTPNVVLENAMMPQMQRLGGLECLDQPNGNVSNGHNRVLTGSLPPIAATSGEHPAVNQPIEVIQPILQNSTVVAPTTRANPLTDINAHIKKQVKANKTVTATRANARYRDCRLASPASIGPRRTHLVRGPTLIAHHPSS
jgi:hypothetical protein